MDGNWVREYSHVSDDVRVNESTFVVALEFFTANSAARRLMAEAFGRQRGGDDGFADRPYWWLLCAASVAVACR